MILVTHVTNTGREMPRDVNPSLVEQIAPVNGKHGGLYRVTFASGSQVHVSADDARKLGATIPEPKAAEPKRKRRSKKAS